jgi:phytoene desaturase
MSDYDAIVIGAGLGGLSAGAMLAKQGFKTLVCEHTSRVGGCCSSFEHEGYTFDMGASIVEMAWIIDELFTRLGKKTSDYMEMVPIDPIYGFVTGDGERFTYPVDKDATREILARISPEDARAWDRFATVGSEAINEVFGTVMSTPMQSMLDAVKIGMANPKMIKYISYMLKSFESTLCSFFKDDKVRASMSMQSYYIGLPPALCPGYAAFLAYSEHEGIFYPRGGMIKIPEGIARVFTEFGGEIRLDTTVRRVLLEGNRAVGVELADGTQIRSRLVLSNINAKTLYLDLIGRDKIPGWAARAVDSYELSIPCPMIMLGMDAAPELEAHHTICYGTMQEMNSAYFDYFKKGKLHDGGMMIICWPTHADPSLAPEGHHALNIVTLAPYDLAEGDWDGMKDAYLETMLNAVEKKFHINLRDHITTAKVNTPKDFERALLHPRGAVYGLNNDLFSTAMFRPGLRSRVVKGLYLAGASTHFGGGVPTTVGSGVAVSGLIEKDFS